MTRIAILGATGYTALELVKILLRHPEAEMVVATSRQAGSPPIAMIHPSLNRRVDLNLEDLEPAEVAARADCASVACRMGRVRRSFLNCSTPDAAWSIFPPTTG